MTLVATGLTKTFTSGYGADRVTKLAVDNVSLKVRSGELVAVVGESGSGKTTCARMMLDLIRPDSGSVSLDGVEVASMNRAGKRRFRSTVQAIFQDPSGSLNPRKRIRTILTEVIRFYGLGGSATGVERVALESLKLVGLTPPRTYMERFPHELSGGQRQRVLIARSMIPGPKIIVADEAVSALDVSVKAEVLRLMENLRFEKGIGYLLITHDLQIVRKVASYVYVMRNGAVVEEGPTERIFREPQAAYTRTLLSAGLDLEAVLEHRREAANAVQRPGPGMVPASAE